MTNGMTDGMTPVVKRAWPLRPWLSGALAMLTDTPAELWDVALAPWKPPSTRTMILDARGVRFELSTGGRVLCATGPSPAWAFEEPEDAFEAMIARGMLPESWAQSPERAWTCARCNGSGGDPTQHKGCGPCELRGWVLAPPTFGVLLAWASLGQGQILRVEELARLSRRALAFGGGATDHRVVWQTTLRRTDLSMRSGGRFQTEYAWVSDYEEGRPTRTLSTSGVLRSDRGSDTEIVPAVALWNAGFSLDRIEPELVVRTPPVEAGP